MREKPKYLFFKKIKPDQFLWCTSMQTRVMFEDEVWIGVVSEHYLAGHEYSGKVFYGNIFTNNTAFGVYVTSYDIEFEVWEKSSTEGERIEKQIDIPSRCQMPLYMDFPCVGTSNKNRKINSLVDSILPNKCKDNNEIPINNTRSET